MSTTTPKTSPRSTIIALAGVSAVLLVFTFILQTFTFQISNNSYVASVRAASLVNLTNASRKEAGLQSLTINPLLVQAAQQKAEDMAKLGYFAHTSPEGLTPWYWIKNVGYKYDYAGENLAVHFSSSRDVQNAWLDSPTHRANILDKKFTEIGIATSVGTYKNKKTVFVVQMFGKPQAGFSAASVSANTTQQTKSISRSQLQGLSGGAFSTNIFVRLFEPAGIFFFVLILEAVFVTISLILYIRNTTSKSYQVLISCIGIILFILAAVAQWHFMGLSSISPEIL